MEPKPVEIVNGHALYRCNPKLSIHCKKTACFIHGGECHLTQNKAHAMVIRADYIRVLDDSALAEYLAQELEAGVPVDWYAWLMEEV